MEQQHIDTIVEALEKQRTIHFTFRNSEARERHMQYVARIDAALEALRAQAQPPTPNNVPLYTNEQIDDIVDNHIFLDNGTATHKVWQDRANKYLREMRDKYERDLAFWQRYGVVKNLELVELRAQAQPPQQPMDFPDGPGWWAWEEGEQRGVSEIYEGFQAGELIVDEEPGGLNPDYYSGRKWYRLTMPWDAQPPAPQPVPQEVREALRKAIQTRRIVLHGEIKSLREQDMAEIRPYLDEMDMAESWLAQQPAPPQDAAREG